jgi:protein-tyrosine phosphatase
MKILMVCLGNICRSPMAEGLMQAKIQKYRLRAEVDSAGFESFHTGDAPDYRAQQVMLQHGIDISRQRSRLFRKSDFETFDRIYVMDSGNYSDVRSMADHAGQMQKVDYIMNILHPGSNKAVPDPYYGGKEGFETTYKLLDAATEQIAKQLTNTEN